MAQEITTRPNVAPTPQTREFRDLLGVYGNRIETTAAGTWLISSSQAPVGADLERIEARRSELAAGMARTDPALIAPRISRLFLRFPSVRLENPAATMAAYATDLSEFPLWAIESAIIALLKGHGLPNREFAPSSIVVRDAVVREVARVEAELAAINRILRAKPRPVKLAHDTPSKEALLRTVDEMVGGMRKAAGGLLRGGMTDDEVLVAQAVSAALDAGRPDPRPMPKLSPYLRQRYGLAETRSEDAA